MPTSHGEIEHPGAGTLYVYTTATSSSTTITNEGRRKRASPSPAGKAGSPSRLSKVKAKREASPFPPLTPSTKGLDYDSLKWEQLVQIREDPRAVSSLDSLLSRGIDEYTHLPAHQGGVLGRGKFSTVYKVVCANGDHYALKHTPLYPHHPLISARLLREPTLLSELPTHPCLIGVEGWVRTEGHFYLIEQYAAHHVPLPNHPLPLSPSRAAYILDQLVSVVRDCLHDKGRVCHRDLKGDNVLVDIDTGDIIILDLGLATRFSASQPKLTTCCGSPAFHSPEIVLALSRPPGEVTYYGPELDIWCIALVLLSLLLQVRFPLGPKHTSPYVMRERVMDRLQELDALYPPHAPWRSRPNSQVDIHHEKKEWRRVRKALSGFLDVDGKRRMAHFRNYEIGEKIRKRLEAWQVSELGQDEQEQIKKKFKQTSFLPAEVKYTLPIYLDFDEQDPNCSKLILHNTLGESQRRVTSYIKYLLRCAGILYHVHHIAADPSTLKQDNDTTHSMTPTIIQLVLSIPDTLPTASVPPPSSSTSGGGGGGGWFPNLFNLSRKGAGVGATPLTPDPTVPTPVATSSQRSASVPAGAHRHARSPSPAAVPLAQTSSRSRSLDRVIRCWIKIEFDSRPSHSHSHSHSHSEEKDREREGERERYRPRNLRQVSTDTFTSFREGLGLSPMTPNPTSQQASLTSTTTPRSASASASASRMRMTSGPQLGHGNGIENGAKMTSTSNLRPGQRRTVSHNRIGGWAPASSGSVGMVTPSSPRTRATTSLTPIVTTVNGSSANINNGSHGNVNANINHTGVSASASASGSNDEGRLNPQTVAPFSPLCRQVSLPSSSSSPTSPTVSVSSRAPSRASSRSRSRKTSGQYPLTPSISSIAGAHVHAHAQAKFHTNTISPNTTLSQGYQGYNGYGSASKVIITISDPRGYSVLRKALDVQPLPSTSTSIHNGHERDRDRDRDSPLLLSPMTIRRPSLAPSLSLTKASVSASEGIRIEEGELHIDIIREIGELDHYVDLKISNQQEMEEAEEERGRRRSKDDYGHSSVYNHLQKIKIKTQQQQQQQQQQPRLNVIQQNQSQIDNDNDRERERERSRGRSKPRGLFNAIFGSGSGKDKRSISMPPTSIINTNTDTTYS